MKRLIVEQMGYVQIEVKRAFVIEVPDGVSADDAKRALNEGEPPSDTDNILWTDEDGTEWMGFHVEDINNWVYDPDEVLGAPRHEVQQAIPFDVLFPKEDE